MSMSTRAAKRAALQTARKQALTCTAAARMVTFGTYLAQSAVVIGL